MSKNPHQSFISLLNLVPIIRAVGHLVTQQVALHRVVHLVVEHLPLPGVELHLLQADMEDMAEPQITVRWEVEADRILMPPHLRLVDMAL